MKKAVPVVPARTGANGPAAWCGWPCVSLGMLLLLVWLNEIFGLHSRIFGSAPSRPEWSSACLLTVGVFAAGLIAVVPAYLRRKTNGRHAVTVCSYCRRVQVSPKSWQHIEQILAEKTMSTLSHGVCPDCSERVMNDYRCGKKNAGARETIQSEIFV